VCGYHGFAYDPDGCLVNVPSQENLPPGARVRSYPSTSSGRSSGSGSVIPERPGYARRLACRGMAKERDGEH